METVIPLRVVLEAVLKHENPEDILRHIGKHLLQDGVKAPTVSLSLSDLVSALEAAATR